jgi:hypothetical protein
MRANQLNTERDPLWRSRKSEALVATTTVLLLGTIAVVTACGDGGRGDLTKPNTTLSATAVPDIRNAQDLRDAEARLQADIQAGKPVTIELGDYTCTIGKVQRTIANPVETIVDGQETIGSLTPKSDGTVDVHLIQLSNPNAPSAEKGICVHTNEPLDFYSVGTKQVVFKREAEPNGQELPITPYNLDGTPAEAFGDAESPLPIGWITLER